MHPIECASISEMQGLQLSTLKSFCSCYPGFDSVARAAKDEMRVSDKAAGIASATFHLSSGVCFLAPCGKNKIKKATERLGGWGRGVLGASRQKGFPASKILRSQAQRNNQGFETLALSLVFFLQLLLCLNSWGFFSSSLSKTHR